MTPDRRTRFLAAVLLALLGLLAAEKARAGILPEMLWACHVATALVATGVLLRAARVVAVGFLFHAGIGLPAFGLELAAGHGTTWPSALLHALTPVTGWLALRRTGIPRGAVLHAWLFFLVMQPVGWLAPEALNVNVAHRPWSGLPWEAGPRASRLLNASGALLFLAGAGVSSARLMERRDGKPRLLRETTGLCGRCKRGVPASVWLDGGEARLRKRCPEHGDEEVLLSGNGAWYEETEAFAAVLEPPLGEAREVRAGCPFDCGPCTAHEQRLHLPVLPITSACNLDCPICYTHNKSDGAWHMDERELEAILAHLRRAAPEKRIVNLTGGEPTQHPLFERIVERCREEGIRRVTVSTHGLHLLGNEPLVARLKALDARVILSFDSFREDVNRRMLGGAFGAGKLKVLDLLEKHDVDTTLLPVVARGLNDGEIWAIVRLALEKAFIRSVELHPMTFTGQRGASFDRAARYGAWEALADLETRAEGRLRVSDFVPSPAAHPQCYQVTYLLRLEDGRWLPFPRFLPRAAFRRMLGRGLYLLPGPEMEEALREAIDALFAGAPVDGADPVEVLSALRALLDDAAAPGASEEERLRRAERRTKAVYVHTHMDEETFDTDRIRRCCVGMPGADGTSIPSCAYNVLYRERDARFTATPAPALVTLGKGRFPRPMEGRIG